MPYYIIFFVAILGFLVGLTSLILTIRLYRKIHFFMMGKEGKSLEDSFSQVLHALNDQKNNQLTQSEKIEKIIAEIEHLSQEPACIRFNPFNDSGGNQCFALAILSKSGNGIVISSLYAQGKTSVFAKPIQNYNSKYDLTIEEKEVISRLTKTKNYVN